MPPQPGVFSLPFSHKPRQTYPGDIPEVSYYQHVPVAGPSSRMHAAPNIDEGRRDRDKKKRDIAGKLGKEMSDRRDDGRQFAETIHALQITAAQLAMRPETVPLFNLRLLPITMERSAILAQLEAEEKYAIECARTAYEEERERVDEEWRRGRDRVRERLMEGIEERRRRAREEKEGEGTVGDGALDVQTRPHITRKLRNKLGTSPPPTPLGGPGTLIPNTNGISSLPITTGPFLNPHSLSVDEIPSPFPLPLTSTTIPNGNSSGTGGGTGGGGGGGRRRPKGGGGHQSQAIGGLGKSLALLSHVKDNEVEADLGEIRRGSKRRRTAVGTGGKANI
ncbi:hypothetical protein AX16_003489 [Volvariella volvacea WC 439]|nr:hypothetical protein AX16_003489 [Volvariella volvacea WC 439]